MPYISISIDIFIKVLKHRIYIETEYIVREVTLMSNFVCS